MQWWASVMFVTVGRYGWEELFYQQAGTLADAMSQLQQLASLRAPFTSADASIWKLRVSAVGSPRLSWDGPGVTCKGASPALEGTDGLMLRLAGGARGLHRREYHIRGLPADFFGAVGKGLGDALVAVQYRPALITYLKELSSGRWYLKTNAFFGTELAVEYIAEWTLDGGNILGVPIAGLAPPDGGSLLYAFTGQAGNPQATKVRVRGVRISPNTPKVRRQVNGVFPIVAFDDGGVYWTGTLGNAMYSAGGLIQQQGSTFEPIQATTIRGRASRKTGPAPKGADRVPPGSVTSPSFPPPPVPSAPPVPPPAQPAWNPGPVARELATNQAAVALNFEGYDPHQDGKLYPIALAPLIDYPNTWLVSVAGVNRSAENQQNFWNAILAGLNFGSTYQDTIVAAIEATIPVGDRIIWHGHSMGGIIGQNLAARQGFTARNPIQAVVTWGSPTTAPESDETLYYRFSEPDDIVAMDVGALLTLKGRAQRPQFIVAPSSPDITKFQQHNDYDKAPSLLAVVPTLGLNVNPASANLRLGTIQRFPAD